MAAHNYTVHVNMGGIDDILRPGDVIKADATADPHWAGVVTDRRVTQNTSDDAGIAGEATEHDNPDWTP